MRTPRRPLTYQTTAPPPVGPGPTRAPVRPSGGTRWVRSGPGSGTPVETPRSEVITTPQGAPRTPGRARHARRLSWVINSTCAKPRGLVVRVGKVDSGYPPGQVQTPFLTLHRPDPAAPLHTQAAYSTKSPNTSYVRCLQSLVASRGELIRVEGRSGPKHAETPR